MRVNKYSVHLSQDERKGLKALVSTGQSPARMIRRAQILLKADEGWTDDEIRAAVGVSRQTVHDVRQECVQEGVDKTVRRTSGRPAGSQTRVLDGVAEAHLIALACSEPPDGHDRWTLRLLASRMVALEHVETVSHESVRMALKKTNLNLGSSKRGASRPGKTRRS